MSIVIIKPGLLDTFQDLGRYGYGRIGINPSGVMDKYAAQIANSLAGNEGNEAVLECHFPAAQILFETDSIISITGSDFTPILNNESLPLWKPILIRKNTLLQFRKIRHGSRCYIAVRGGFEIVPWLGSFSTNVVAKAGGWHGRKLKLNDRICTRQQFDHSQLNEQKIFSVLPWQADTTHMYQKTPVFFIRGNEWNNLDESSKEIFLRNSFTIDQSSDKMGYNLIGEQLLVKSNTELVSAPVSFGTVQLLPNGRLIILMSEHQTTGGYPRIAHIITAHLPAVAQMKPGTAIRFKETDIATAEELLFSQQKDLALIRDAGLENLKSHYDC